ncbi:hypothetical protein PILCRDRAFT_467037 [Piloderma croceum F 1598]|uniref:Uncharacterized protein n=1 Tax=Piloderma croceum (strain F 1598) TaxID=765440 RepID=A0A0C3FUK0_PILCF|nr:hypothetical protein PILCRDRAFT_467037 [Piloderma croceum F 1598]
MCLARRCLSETPAPSSLQVIISSAQYDRSHSLPHTLSLRLTTRFPLLVTAFHAHPSICQSHLLPNMWCQINGCYELKMHTAVSTGSLDFFFLCGTMTVLEQSWSSPLGSWLFATMR